MLLVPLVPLVPLVLALTTVIMVRVAGPTVLMVVPLVPTLPAAIGVVLTYVMWCEMDVHLSGGTALVTVPAVSSGVSSNTTCWWYKQ